MQRLFLPIALLILSSGCGLFFTPEDNGKVYVSHPQVFTRERMLKVRNDEYQWLKNILASHTKETKEGKFKPSFQAYSDFQLTEELKNTFKAKSSPELALQQEQIKSGIKGTKEDRQLQSMRNQVEMQKLQNKLDELRTPPTPPSNYGNPYSNSYNSSSSYSPNNSNTSTNTQSYNRTSNTSQYNNSRTTTPTRTTNSMPTNTNHSPQYNHSKPTNTNRPGTNTVAPEPKGEKPNFASKVQLSRMDQLRDERAYREELLAAMEEKQLDDIHDFYGSTLYNLKFDLTLMPGKHSSRYAMITLQLQDSVDGAKIDGHFFQKWVQSLREDVQREVLFLQRHLLADHLPNEVMIWLHSETELASEYKEAFENFASSSQEERKKSLHDPEQQELLMKGIAYYVQARYSAFFNGIVSLTPPIPVDMGSKVFYVNDVQPESDGLENFRRGCGRLSSKTYVSIVEPKEYAQNISDVARSEKNMQLIFSLSAMLPQGMSMSNSLEKMRKSQSLLHGIQRRPLVMGYSNGLKEFGWLVGPKFFIEDGEASYRHTPVRYAFNVSLVIPAWWSSLRLKGKYGWLDEKGEVVEEKPLWENEGGAINVDLPADLHISQLTTALLHKVTNVQRKPTIDVPVYPPRKIVLQAQSPRPAGAAKPKQQTTSSYNSSYNSNTSYNNNNSNSSNNTASTAKPSRLGSQQIVIHGRDLWRNPEVYVGFQKADRIAILPNMEGLVATFDNFLAPPNQQDVPVLKDLVVVTSIGVARSQDAVVILPKDGWAEIGWPYARVKTPYLVGGQETIISLRPSLFPAMMDHVHVALKPRKYNTSSSTTMKPSQINKDEVVFSSLPPMVGNVEEWTLELELKVKNNTRSVFLTPSTIVRFKDANAQKLALNTHKLQIDENWSTNENVSVKIPYSADLFYKAYSGFQESSNSGMANLRFKQNGQVIAEFPVELENNNLVTRPGSLTQTKIKRLLQGPTAGNGVKYQLDVEIQEKHGSEVIPVKEAIEVIAHQN